MAGAASDRRGLTIGSTYYAGAMGGYRRLLTAPSSNTEAVTLWSLKTSGSGDHTHAETSEPSGDAQLVELTQFVHNLDGPAQPGFKFASVSTTTGSVVAITQGDRNGPIWTFLPKSADSYEPVMSVFKASTKGSVRLAGS